MIGKANFWLVWNGQQLDTIAINPEGAKKRAILLALEYEDIRLEKHCGVNYGVYGVLARQGRELIDNE